MKTLFIVASTAFVISALAWYFTWAIWIHAPKGWFGRAFSPLVAAREGVEPAVRHLAWYRSMRITTVILLITAAALFIAWMQTSF